MRSTTLTQSPWTPRCSLSLVALCALGTAFACGSDAQYTSPQGAGVPLPGLDEPGDNAATQVVQPNQTEPGANSIPSAEDSTPSTAPNGQMPTSNEAVAQDAELVGNQEPVTGDGSNGDETADDSSQPTPAGEQPAEQEPTEPEGAVEAPAFGTVEDNGLDCPDAPLPSFDDLTAEPTLPDPFLGLNGERITERDQWRCRRQEIKRLAERFVYGEKPPAPESVTGTVTAQSIAVNVTSQGQSASFNLTVTMPPGASGPVPAVIGFGGSTIQGTVLEEGVAYINFNANLVADETTRFPKQGAFYTVNPDHQTTGNLVAWAWGISRTIDVIEQSGAGLIDPTGIGVHGCSRSGKGAFISGAFDERVGLTIPLESGMSGVPAFRFIAREPGGEVLRNAFEYRPWAGDAYRDFLVLEATDQNDTAGRDRDQRLSGELMQRLPLDTHEVIGMIAPRGLFVMGNPGIPALSPQSEHITVQAGAEIYAALGVPNNITYSSNTAVTQHCGAPRPEYYPALRENLRKFLKHEDDATPGGLNPSPNVASPLGPDINWDTPQLQ